MIVTLLGLIISFSTYVIAFPQPHQRRLDVFLALLIVHLIAMIAYWLFGFVSALDAYTYYRDPYNFYSKNPLESGTFFIAWLDQVIKRTIGGSFLDHFFLFQSFGMIGLALIIRSFNEIAESLGIAVPLHVYAIMFLPGLHFWSVAIGKDGLMIMGISMSLWAAMKIERRYVVMLVGLGVMSLIRPHIAAFALLAIVCSMFLNRRVPLFAKLLFVPVTVAGLVFAVLRAQVALSTGDDMESISSFIEGQQGLGAEYGSGANIQSLPYLGKLFTLLFRPMFVDAEGLMGLVASMENVILLAIFAYILYNFKILLSLFRKVAFVSYAFVFSGVVIFMLSLVNYNVGLGLRQKMMAIPGILLIYATIQLYRQYLRSPAALALEVPAEPEAYHTIARA